MKKELSKTTKLGIGLGTLALIGSGITLTDKMNCDYTIEYRGEEVCIDEEVKEAIQSNLEPNNGFGGVQFKKNEK